jgi:hypothetical protein
MYTFAGVNKHISLIKKVKKNEKSFFSVSCSSNSSKF